MLPAIRPGDSLLIQPLHGRNGILKQSDIVLFQRKERLICHRILLSFNLGTRVFYIEKGDNNIFAGIVNENRILGRILEINGKSDLANAGREISTGRLILDTLKTFFFRIYDKLLK